MAELPNYLKDPKELGKYLKKIRELRGSLTKTVGAAQKAESDTKASSNNAATILEKLDQDIETAKTALAEIPGYQDELNRHKALLDDPKDGSQALLDKNKELEEKLEKNLASAEGLNEKLNSSVDRAEQLHVDAQSILGRIASGALADTFGKRAEKLSKSKLAWRKILGWSLVLLLIALFFVYFQIKNEIYSGNTSQTHNASLILAVLRIGFFTPLIFVIFFASRQYSHERDLEERYEHKSSVAATLPSFTKLLKDEYLQKDGTSPTSREKIKENILAKTLDWIDIVYADTRDVKNENKLALKVRHLAGGAEIEQSSSDQHTQSVSVQTPGIQAASTAE